MSPLKCGRDGGSHPPGGWLLALRRALSKQRRAEVEFLHQRFRLRKVVNMGQLSLKLQTCRQQHDSSMDKLCSKM